MYGLFAGTAAGLLLIIARWTPSTPGLCAVQFATVLGCGIGGGLVIAYVPKTKVIGVLAGLAVGLIVIVGCYLGVALLGIVTGVIARCATAPEWWGETFVWLFYSWPLWGGIAAICCGWKVFRWYERRHAPRPPYAMSQWFEPKRPVP